MWCCAPLVASMLALLVLRGNPQLKCAAARARCPRTKLTTDRHAARLLEKAGDRTRPAAITDLICRRFRRRSESKCSSCSWSNALLPTCRPAQQVRSTITP